MEKTLILLPIIALVLGCTDMDDQPSGEQVTSELNFSLTSKVILSTDARQEITVNFDKPAVENGHFRIKFSGEAIYGEHFVTEPASVNEVIDMQVLKGEKKATFSIQPLERPDQLGTKVSRFTILESSSKLIIGSQKNFDLSIVQMDGENPGNEPAKIGFESKEIELLEDEIAGVEILLPISGNVKQSARVDIRFSASNGFSYGKDFTTEPLAVFNELSLDVYPGLENLKLKLLPINDQLLEGDFEVNFKIMTVSEGLEINDQADLTVRIKEDDTVAPELIHDIAALKAKFEEHEGDWYLPEDYYIQGVVTSHQNVVNEKTVYIQDETGGIMLVFYAERLLKQGDKVLLNLRNANGAIINEQLAMTGLIDRLGIKLAENVYVQPETITLEELASGKYQGKKVMLERVKFQVANGENVWNGSRLIEDAGGKVGRVFTYEWSGFGQQVLPSGTVTLVGIVGGYNSLHVQRYPQDVYK
ncbi:hypothetical protein GCM10028791_22640 [Echinicola sediminis]